MGLEVQAAPEGLIRLEHTEIHLDKPTYCAWGLKNPGRCVAGVGPDSAFSAADVIPGAVIKGGSRSSLRGRQRTGKMRHGKGPNGCLERGCNK